MNVQHLIFKTLLNIARVTSSLERMSVTSKLIVILHVFFITGCNVTNPTNLDFYRTILPEKTTNIVYTNLNIAPPTDNSLCNNETLSSSTGTSITNYYFFHRYRERVSYLTDKIATNELKEYDICLTVQINTADLSISDTNTPNVTSFTNEDLSLSTVGVPTITFYEFATGETLSAGFSGTLSLTVTTNSSDNTVESGDIVLNLIHELNARRYQFSGTFSPP